MFRREVFTQISAQAVPKPQTAFSHQVGSDRGPAEETRQLAARRPPAAIAAADAPKIMANGRQTLPWLSQPQVHYAHHRSARVLGKTRKVRVSVEYDRVTCEPHPGTSFVTYDLMWQEGHIVVPVSLTIDTMATPPELAAGLVVAHSAGWRRRSNCPGVSARRILPVPPEPKPTWADGGRESAHALPLPPNRTGGFPAYGSPVSSLLSPG